MSSFRSKILHRLTGLIRQPRHTDFVQSRQVMEKMTSRFPAPRGVSFAPTVIAGIPAEWVTAPEHTDGVILYLHGGAYVMGSPRTHRIMTVTLAKRCRMRVLAADYRMAPEHPFPAALEDALACYRNLLAQGISPQQILIAGDSAGGGLTLALLLHLRDLGEVLPAGGILISPWTDLALTGQTLATNDAQDHMLGMELLQPAAALYIGADDAHNPLISPLYGSMAGLPPLLIQVGTYEMLLDDAKRVAEQAQAAGVDVRLQIYHEVEHVWHLFTFLPEAQRAFDEIASFAMQRIALS